MSVEPTKEVENLLVEAVPGPMPSDTDLYWLLTLIEESASTSTIR